MGNFNLFDLIRDGVRRSILGGVEDAVQIIGLPPDSDTTKSVLFKNLLTDDTVDTASTKKIASGSRGGQSKLGRGIGDLQPVKEV